MNFCRDVHHTLACAVKCSGLSGIRPAGVDGDTDGDAPWGPKQQPVESRSDVLRVMSDLQPHLLICTAQGHTSK